MLLVQRKIVIIDDSPETRVTSRRFLQRTPNVDYTIWEEERGGTGLATARAVQPGGILLNYQLLDLDGLEFLRRLEKIDPPFPCAVVVETRTGRKDIFVETLKQDAHDYLVKDQVTQEMLRRTMKHAIEKRDWRQKLEEQQRTAAAYNRELEKAQEALRQVHENECLTIIGAMAIHFTHHLGNHFNNLFTSVQILERRLATLTDHQAPQLRQIAHDLREELSRSLSLLDDLHLLSNVHTLQLQPTDVAAVVNTVVSLQAHAYAKRGVREVLNFALDLPQAQVDWDRDILQPPWTKEQPLRSPSHWRWQVTVPPSFRPSRSRKNGQERGLEKSYDSSILQAEARSAPWALDAFVIDSIAYLALE